jgi:hypothetical protein
MAWPVSQPARATIAVLSVTSLLTAALRGLASDSARANLQVLQTIICSNARAYFFNIGALRPWHTDNGLTEYGIKLYCILAVPKKSNINETKTQKHDTLTNSLYYTCKRNIRYT